jgi:phosphatidylglycerophosphate synthase
MVRTGPAIGLLAQIVLLAGLGETAGLSGTGWLVGLSFGAALCGLLTWGMHRTGTLRLGPADWVTLSRAVLIGGVAALTADSFDRAIPVRLLVVLTIMALVLDGVDGQVARRTGTVSVLGARFDMEVDSALLLVLSLYAAHPVGAWVLVIGLMRYVFVVATWLLPWMQATLPPRYWRKIVASTQGVTLVAASSGLLPLPLMVAALMIALALLVESFGRDVLWLWLRRVPAMSLTARGSTVDAA